MRPAQFSQILPTPPLGREPQSKLLIRPRIVTPADRTVANHEHTLLHSSRYAGHTFENCRWRLRRSMHDGGHHYPPDERRNDQDRRG